MEVEVEMEFGGSCERVKSTSASIEACCNETAKSACLTQHNSDVRFCFELLADG